MPEGTKILLVDDHAMFRAGIRALLEAEGRMTVVGEASSGDEAVDRVRELKPDVVVMDLSMPGSNGLEATRRIKAEMPEVKVVILSVSGEERDLFEALQYGASGYLLKSLKASELTGLMNELLRGEVSLSPGLASKMLEAFMRYRSPQALTEGVSTANMHKEPDHIDLTVRQMEILRMVAQGHLYKEIALAMGLAEVTIKYHMGEVLARLHLSSRREAVQFFQSGKLNDGR